MSNDVTRHVEAMVSRLEAMIQAAPDVGGVATDAVAKRKVEPVQLRESCGWGRKYVERIELHGEQWHAHFREAQRHIARGGIVIFLGGRGPGKTQMAAEIARAGDWPQDAAEWNGNHAVHGRTALYRRALDVFLDLRDASKNSSTVSEKTVLRGLERCGLLVIDEFQERGETEWEDRIITTLIDRRYAANRPTLIIGNLTREEVSGSLSRSVRDRMFENGKAFVFDWPSYRRNAGAVVD